MLLRTAMVTGLLAAALPPTTGATAQPADCSAGPIPDSPVVLRVPGAPDRPLNAKSFDASGLVIDAPDKKRLVKAHQLVLQGPRGQDVFAKIARVYLGVMIDAHKPLSGQVFRLPANQKPIEPLSGQPLFQGWVVQIPDAAAQTYAVDVGDTGAGFVASIRLEFGKRTGTTTPGKIHMCVPGGQKSQNGQAIRDPIEIVGAFTVSAD